MLGSVSVGRRAFLRGAAAGVALGAGGSWAVAAADDAGWAFPLLGDLHIDRPDHHDADWLKAHHPGDVKQVENYSRVTRETTPKLLAVAREQAVGSRVPVPFVVQLGDLVEGLCGSEALAAKQAADALAMVRDARLPAPFLFAKGNHDVTGPGAAAVYDKVFVPFLAAQADKGIAAAHFTRTHGGTLVVFYDAYDRGSLDWFEGLMTARRPGRLIFVIHPPVVPYTARSTWHVYSSPRQQHEQARLLALLGAANAVVLCGHLHKYGFLVRRTDAGRFAQLAVSSVATDAEALPNGLREGIDRYGPDLADLEPKHSPETVGSRRKALADEKPFIEHYEYADTWGHARLTVRGDGVRAEVYRGLSRSAWKNLDLTARPG